MWLQHEITSLYCNLLFEVLFSTLIHSELLEPKRNTGTFIVDHVAYCTSYQPLVSPYVHAKTRSDHENIVIENLLCNILAQLLY
jgi:hypothetical protein